MKTPFSSGGAGSTTYGHFSSERLAELVAGAVTSEAELGHLASCRACAAGYAELVRLTAEMTESPMEAPEEFLEEGHRFVDHRIGTQAQLANRSLTRRVWARGVIPALAVAALMLLMLWPRAGDHYPDGAELPDPVRQALLQDSAFGMVHPLVAGADAFEAPVTRGSGVEMSLDASIESLMESHAEVPSDARRSAALVAAFQAAEQPRNARSYLDQARVEHPQDLRLEMLEIQQDYLDGDLDRAELALRLRAERDERDDLARLNLAILLTARGDPGSAQESQRLARALLERLDGGGLARRAQQLLD